MILRSALKCWWPYSPMGSALGTLIVAVSGSNSLAYLAALFVATCSVCYVLAVAITAFMWRARQP